LGLLLATVGARAGTREKPPLQYQIPLPPPPDFSALDWLQGHWTGKTVSPGPAGEVDFSVTPELENHFLVFREETSLAATPTLPASKESWVGFLGASPDGKGFVLRVFSSTGFMTRYRMTVDGPELHLNPEGGESPPPGWLFRRSWARTGSNKLTETVQAAPPGKGFFLYYSADLARAPAPAKPAPAP